MKKIFGSRAYSLSALGAIVVVGALVSWWSVASGAAPSPSGKPTRPKSEARERLSRFHFQASGPGILESDDAGVLSEPEETDAGDLSWAPANATRGGLPPGPPAHGGSAAPGPTDRYRYEDCHACLAEKCADEIATGANVEGAEHMLLCEPFLGEDRCIQGIPGGGTMRVQPCPGGRPTEQTRALIQCGAACPCSLK